MIALGYAFLSGGVLYAAVMEFHHGYPYGWPLACSGVSAALAVAFRR